MGHSRYYDGLPFERTFFDLGYALEIWFLPFGQKYNKATNKINN